MGAKVIPFMQFLPLTPTAATLGSRMQEGTYPVDHLADPSPVSDSVAATPAGLRAPQRQTL